MSQRYLKGEAGSIFYGGEEYAFPGGKRSASYLDNLWRAKLDAKGATVGQVMDQAATYKYASERGYIARFVISWESGEGNGSAESTE